MGENDHSTDQTPLACNLFLEPCSVLLHQRVPLRPILNASSVGMDSVNTNKEDIFIHHGKVFGPYTLVGDSKWLVPAVAEFVEVLFPEIEGFLVIFAIIPETQ